MTKIAKKKEVLLCSRMNKLGDNVKIQFKVNSNLIILLPKLVPPLSK